MPAQDLAGGGTLDNPRSNASLTLWVRVAVISGAALLTAAFAVELYRIVSFVRLEPLLLIFLLIATITFAWVALGTMMVAAGFVLLMRGAATAIVRLEPPMATAQRTALLFPVYHESPAQIAGTIEALAAEIAGHGAGARFDVFILSDTRDGNDARVEQAMFADLARALSKQISIDYRRRKDNTGKKAGNIEDWIKRCGAAYGYFVVLDADSLMSANLLLRLVSAMDRDTSLALLQSPPRLIGGASLFQRLQQFAGSVYGPLSAAGVAAFNGRDGNYWGHNAIIRTAAFAEAAGLPVLPGRKPFGGHIQSHDFVEACLLLRAGWAVAMAPDNGGSYEGCPPNLVDHAVRERRWAQGNLQHLAVLRHGRLTTMGRFHLAMGAASYLASSVWLSMVLVGAAIALSGIQPIPSYFGREPQLFPIWPQIDPDAAIRLFSATLVVVFLPKVLGLIWRLRSNPGLGRARSAAGVIVETALSTLVAPVLMAVHARSVAEILLGKDAGWMAQQRDRAGLSFFEALRFNWPHMLLGGLIAAASAVVSLHLLAWAAPVCIGLLLSAPLTWWSARTAGPRLAYLLSTPEDIRPPVIAEQSIAAAAVWNRSSSASPSRCGMH